MTFALCNRLGVVIKVAVSSKAGRGQGCFVGSLFAAGSSGAC